MQLLPFQFSRFGDNEYLVVGESGEYFFMTADQFYGLISGDIEQDLRYELKSRHLLCESNLPEVINLISTKYRTRKRFVSDFTVLHMMVLTLRCTNDCAYCQVTAEGEEAKEYDMTSDVARKIIDMIFQSPGNYLKIEFQGGEPTLNWQVLAESVIYADKLSKRFSKHVEFVVCTNLVSVSDSQLGFYKKYKISLSTSLDGPKYLHDKHRYLKNGHGTYEKVVENIRRARGYLGLDSVSALMTITRDNVGSMIDIIDEYIDKGFGGVFIRSLNPYGQASRKIADLGYSVDVFVENYFKALDYIIAYNVRTGKLFIEYFATLLLARILTPFSTGFVDLQSPSGAGISGVIYDHNGDVYPSDEARMLSRMGDKKFLMGNVLLNSYEDIFGGEVIRDITSNSCVEIMPYCATCVYQAYCGSDPIRNYLSDGNMIGRRPDNGFCSKNKMLFDGLFKKIRMASAEEVDVLWSWVSNKNLSSIKKAWGQDEGI